MSPVRAGVRVFFYGFVGTLILSGVASTVAVSGVVDWAVVQKAVVSACAGGVTGLLAFAYNLLEDKNVVPSTKGDQ